MKTITFVTFILFVSCGKIQQVQDSFVGLSTNNDLNFVEVRLGAYYRNDPQSQPQGYDFIEYEGTQYRLGDTPSSVASEVAKLPRSQLIPVYFKGQFVKRSGVSAGNPAVQFDVIDLEALTKK